MAGLDTRGLASGFAQGFGLANQYQQQQRQNSIQDEQLTMQREQYQQQQQDRTRTRDMENIQFTLAKIGQGLEVDESEMELLKRYPKFRSVLDMNTDDSIAQAETVIDPNTPVDANQPESLVALNQMFGPEINKGDGADKRVIGMYPAPDGQSVMLELEVMGEDGQRYTAPMTEGRSTNEDATVMAVPVERLVEQIQGMRTLRNIFRTPQAQERANKVLNILRGGDNEQWETEQHPRLGMIQRNTTTGEIKPVKGGAGSPFEQRSGSSGNVPSRIQEAQALVDRGVYDSFDEAYEAVRASAGQGLNVGMKNIDHIENKIKRIDDRLNAGVVGGVTEEEAAQLREERAALVEEQDRLAAQVFRPGGQGLSLPQGGSEQPAPRQEAERSTEAPEPNRSSAETQGEVPEGTGEDFFNYFRSKYF